MVSRNIFSAVLLPLLFLAAGCTSISSNYTGEITRADPARIYMCHGYDCTYKTRIDIGAPDAGRFASIMATGAASPESERAAISRAVQHYEEMGARAIGIRDQAKSTFGDSREKGQMDCIDESTNTRSLLLYLAKSGLLKHHKVEMNVSRGFFIDGRYPHSTAVIRDPDGRKWAVDSWYEPMGGPPDVLPLEKWFSRGVGGQR